MDVTFRPVQASDDDFLFELYASTREEELAQVDWPAAQKHEFLRMQFDAQTRHYAQYYSEASFDVVLVDGQPAGRLYLHRGGKEIRIVDIALLPAYRGQGLGSRLLQRVIDEADEDGKTLSIHVEMYNPARRLYERLGFVRVDDVGVYVFMVRQAQVKIAS